MPPAEEDLRPAYEAAVEAAVHYPRTKAGVADPDASWDELLTAIEHILVVCQRHDLDGVGDAGVSGKVVPPPGAPRGERASG